MSLESGDKIWKYYIQLVFEVMRKNEVSNKVSTNRKEKRASTKL